MDTLEAPATFTPLDLDDGPIRRPPPRRRTAPRRPVPRSVRTSTPSAPDGSDETLVERLRSGEVAAGEALVRRHSGALRRYLHRLAGPVAEELHQQTWLSVLTHLDRFVAGDAPGSFRGWLFRIAANKVKDHWRSASREKSAKEGLRRFAWNEPSYEPAFAAAEQHERLRRAVEALPEGQRHVLMLRYYSDMKFLDIAAVLGCPLNTALTRAHKALLKLRQALAEVG